MTSITAHLLILFRRDLRCLMREVETFPDDAALWLTLPGIANSAGNLALHVTGNLRHFIGAVLGGTGYVRQRDLEFSTRKGTRAEVVAGLETALAEVEAGLPALTAEVLAAPYPAAIGGHRPTTGLLLMHLEAHLAFHLGQAGYLRRALTGAAGATEPMGIPDEGGAAGV